MDIYSDIACPWCFIGDTSLSLAVAALKDVGVKVKLVFHPFVLHPAIPLEVRLPFFGWISCSYSILTRLSLSFNFP